MVLGHGWMGCWGSLLFFSRYDCNETFSCSPDGGLIERASCVVDGLGGRMRRCDVADEGHTSQGTESFGLVSVVQYSGPLRLLVP